MAELVSMKNIGKEMTKKLNSIEIYSAEELKKIGSKETFLRLKTRYSNICLVHLYSLQGAIEDVEYNRLSEETKRDLKAFRDELNSTE